MPQDKPKPQPALALAPAPPVAKCYVKDQPSGGLSVTFQIDAETAKRLRTRAGQVPLNIYLWENILHRAVEAHVY